MFFHYRPLRLTLSAIAVTASLTLAGSVVGADDAVTLSFSYKEGSTELYKMTTTLIGLDAVVKSTTSVTVKEVKPNGEVIMERKVISGTLTQKGKDSTVPTGQPVSEIYDKFGKLTAFKADMAEEAMIALSVQNLIALADHVILPAKAVKPGDTWQTSLDNPAVKGKKVSIKDTYVGKTKKDGVDLWKIKQTLEAEASDDGGKMTSDLTILLDPTNGHEVESTNEFTGIPTTFGALACKSQADLVKDDADTKKP